MQLWLQHGDECKEKKKSMGIAPLWLWWDLKPPSMAQEKMTILRQHCRKISACETGSFADCFLGEGHLIFGRPSHYGNLLKDPLWFQRSPNRGAVQHLHSPYTTKKSQSNRIKGEAQLWAPPRSHPVVWIISTKFDLPVHSSEDSRRLQMHNT